jgi:hypothetical protein
MYSPRRHIDSVQTLTLSIIIVLHLTVFTIADVSLPKRLAFYYGFPSAVNGATGNIDQAINAFSAFDTLVLGDMLEFPQFTSAPGQISDFGCTQNSHNDHENTQTIINHLQARHTQVFGYISVGGENTYRRCTPNGPPVPLTIAEIKDRVDMWAKMNVTGVFFDEAEYGFGSSRALQNEAIEYAHKRSQRVFINGYNPNDVFSTEVLGLVTYSAGLLQGKLSQEPMNEYGARTVLDKDDIYLLEHYQLLNGNFEDGPGWTTRAQAAAKYHKSYGTQIATVTTQADVLPKVADCSDLFDQAKFDYAWWSTLLYGFEFMSWGEPSGFSAFGTCVNMLPWHQTPVVGSIGEFKGEVVYKSPSTIYSRRTQHGLIEVDTSTHTGRFVPN